MSTAKLRYVFPSGYEVKSGATLAISDGVNVLIQSGETIDVDAGATMTIGAASMVINNYDGGSYGLYAAGTVTATGTSFTTVYGVYHPRRARTRKFFRSLATISIVR